MIHPRPEGLGFLTSMDKPFHSFIIPNWVFYRGNFIQNKTKSTAKYRKLFVINRLYTQRNSKVGKREISKDGRIEG